MNRLRPTRDSIWMLTISPTVWALHFLFSYVTAAVWCAKYAGESASLGPARTAIGVYTAIALLGIAITGWIGYRGHSLGSAELPHDEDTPEDRHRFLGYSVLLLSLLSAVATSFVAAVAYFVGSCH
jgi:Mn2+/Fe2+ NRAMP family transporter